MYTIEARQAKSNRYLDSPAESLPKGFDPFNFPIIARHWFGWSPAFQSDNTLFACELAGLFGQVGA